MEGSWGRDLGKAYFCDLFSGAGDEGSWVILGTEALGGSALVQRDGLEGLKGEPWESESLWSRSLGMFV